MPSMLLGILLLAAGPADEEAVVRVVKEYHAAFESNDPTRRIVGQIVVDIQLPQ
jgi:hypothetical protein